MSGWMLAPLGVKEEAFYTPPGHKILDSEAHLLAAEQAALDTAQMNSPFKEEP